MIEEIENITKFDKECLMLAHDEAKKSLESGDFPVGAVIAINNKVLGLAGNSIGSEKNFVNHSENLLIIKFGKELAFVRNKKEKESVRYSTLEPCIQCLGAAIVNRVDKIIFLDRDFDGGACNLKCKHVGGAYNKKNWPKIFNAGKFISSKELMIEFYKKEIDKNLSDDILWYKKKLNRLLK